MDRKKKARLQSAGWAVSSAKDFLGLSEAESALIELKLELSRVHRERRERAGISQQALAKRLHSSQSRVAKMEAGDPSVSMDLLVRSLLVLGTPVDPLVQAMSSGRYVRLSSSRR
jgi:ribosome-binding protein aMBF1 (putative translation factor)